MDGVALGAVEMPIGVGSPHEDIRDAHELGEVDGGQDQGDRATAERQLREALKRNPRFAPALLRLARFAADGGDYQGARQYLERFAAVSAPTAESLYLLVRVERQIGNRNKAVAYERMLKERFPDSVEIQRLRTQ